MKAVFEILDVDDLCTYVSLLSAACVAAVGRLFLLSQSGPFKVEPFSQRCYPFKQRISKLSLAKNFRFINSTRDFTLLIHQPPSGAVTHSSKMFFC